MKLIHITWTIVLLVNMQIAYASKLSDDGRYDLRTVIENYSEINKVKVLVDPRIAGRVSVFGDNLENISYGDLLTILRVHDFTAYKSGEYIIIVPLALAKQLPMPNVEEGIEYLPNEYMTDYIHLEKACPTELLVVLRPILPPTSHVAPINEPRSILVTAVYEKLKLVRELIYNIEDNLAEVANCEITKKHNKKLIGTPASQSNNN